MMREKIFSSVLEGLCYGILGAIFAFFIFGLQETFTSSNSSGINFSIDSPKITIGLAWLLFGLSLSAIFWNVIFGKNTKRFFLKWVLILASASITPVLMQMAFLIHIDNNSRKHSIGYFWELLGTEWMIKLFLILAPFTFLFANRRSIIEKIQNTNSLK